MVATQAGGAGPHPSSAGRRCHRLRLAPRHIRPRSGPCEPSPSPVSLCFPALHQAAGPCARALLLTALASISALPAGAQALPDAFANAFTFRNLGPFRTGAWVTDFAVPDAPERDHQRVFYVATRNGGVWKTVNNGTTFEPVFEGVGPQTIGAVAVAPDDADQVWVGTGDPDLARYAYAGDGVYKSTDGGDDVGAHGARGDPPRAQDRRSPP